MTVTTAIVLCCFVALAFVALGIFYSARRDGEKAARQVAQIKDMERAAEIHKAAADARAVQPDTTADQRLRDIGRLRD